MHNVPTNKYAIIYSERHDSYQLFEDIKGREDVQLIVPRKKKIKNRFLKAVRKIHLSGTIANYVRFPFKSIWYGKPALKNDGISQYYLVFVDMVIADIPVSFLKEAAKNDHIKVILLMINSMCSNTMRQIRKEQKKIDWDLILTFDIHDAAAYGYKLVDYCYYSRHDENELKNNYHKKETDCYFIGTLKTSRKNEILSVYEALRGRGLNSEFHLLKTIKDKTEILPYKDEIDYFSSDRGLIPYEEILASVIKTKVIIEIIQEGQTGPSLRYYEAVCYNKKLLTNNRHIKELPYYDERFMRVFERAEDIDFSWILEDTDVEYYYKGDFSPANLVDKLENYFR